jgi:hypothetical protein
MTRNEEKEKGHWGNNMSDRRKEMTEGTKLNR